MISPTKAGELLRAGKLVAFPTETVYGLGANALDPVAVARIFAAKGRPATSPLIVHVDSLEMARSLAREWPEAAERLAARFWPGPLTLIVKKQPHVPDEVTAGLDSVGLRMPAHPLALELIEAAGVPIAAPSANKFTELSPTTAEHVRESLGDAVDAILDGGACTVGIESTVLSLAGDHPVLLRPGMIGLDELEAEIGPIEVAWSVGIGAHLSPGMHLRHYRPRTPLYLDQAPAEGRGEWLRVSADARDYAAHLYRKLHELDALGLDWIAVEMPPDTPAWAGIRDRLRRAATSL